MPTAIPPTVFNRIIQTKSSPETIAALLNEAEGTYSSVPMRSWAKRRYPYWRPCPWCGQPFSVESQREFWKKLTCSKQCAVKKALKNRGVAVREYPCEKPCERCGAAIAIKNGREWQSKHFCEKCGCHKARMASRKRGAEITCAVCGKKKYVPKAWIRDTKEPTCSKRCAGVLRGKALAKHAHKARAAWPASAEASFREKMTGPNNPAWKGGIMLVNRKGAYGMHKVKYIRCPREYLSMARRDGYVAEHRIVAAMQVGRPLTSAETVHHINHDPEDNRPENLMVFQSNSHHKKYEARGEPAPLWQPSHRSDTLEPSGA